MAKNKIQEGKVLALTAPSGGVVSGNPYKIGQLSVIALETVAETLPFSAAVAGVFQVPKESETVAEGDSLFLKSNGKLTKTATGNKFFGVCVEDGVEADEAKCILANDMASKQAANVAALGTTTDLSAIAASYADLAAARVSVNTLKGEVETRLDAIEAKVDAVLSALKAAGLMANS